MSNQVSSATSLPDLLSDNLLNILKQFISRNRTASRLNNEQDALDGRSESTLSGVTMVKHHRRFPQAFDFQGPEELIREPDDSIRFAQYNIYKDNNVLIYGEQSDEEHQKIVSVGKGDSVDIPDGYFAFRGEIGDIRNVEITISLERDLTQSPTDQKALFSAVEETLRDAETLNIASTSNPVPFQRRKDALESLESQPRKWNLLTGKTSPSFNNDAVVDSTQHDTELYDNPEQYRGIQQSLAADDICVLHGPPGTGKTRVIIEIARRLVEVDRRVLIAAPSHAAADNVLIGKSTQDNTDERSLHHACKEDGFTMARLNADSEKTDPFAAGQYGNGTGMEDVIVSTLNSAAGSGDFEYAIIDEATQATKGDTAIAMAQAETTLLVGDHKQLPPVTHAEINDGLTTFSAKQLYDDSVADPKSELQRLHEKSFFEHLYGDNGIYGPNIGVQFTRQYQMHHDICEFSNQQFYDGSLTTECNPDPVPNYTRMNIVDCDGPEESVSHTYQNQHEADRVVTCLNLLIETKNIDPSEIGVAAAYRLQADFLSGLLVHSSVAGGDQVKVDTFDGFQGSERDVMVLSFTRSNPDNNIGFLGQSEAARRLNVALTRAKRACYLIGNWDTLRGSPQTNLYEDLYQYATTQ